MPEYLTPGVYFELRDSAPPVIRGVRTDITGFVGLAERGPLDKAVQIDSWRQFQAWFGAFVPCGFLAYAVKGFFENGGRTCFVVRVAGVTARKAELLLRNADGTGVIGVSAIDEGAWGNGIEIALTQIRSSDQTFSLKVTLNHYVTEHFRDLSVEEDDPRYFVRFIAKGDDRTAPSRLIRMSNMFAETAPPYPELLPDPDKSGLSRGTGRMSGGKNGLASLTMSDVLGTAGTLSRNKKGLSVFEDVDAVGIICIPDLHVRPALAPAEAAPRKEILRDPCLPRKKSTLAVIPGSTSAIEQAPGFSTSEITAAQRAMVEHCERRKDRIAILEAPSDVAEAQSGAVAEIRGWRSRFDSERGFGALYYPWIRVVDPARPDGDATRAVPPCGHVAGLYARSDFDVGVHKAPANGELHWAEDVTVEVGAEEQAVLNPEGINCLRAFPGRGIRVYGARTISSDSDWRYVNVRRLMFMIEEAVDESTQWAVFESNDIRLRQALTVSVAGFLETLFREGAFAGDAIETSYFIKCDETNNPPEVVDQGRFIMDIGVAPVRPAEFIVFRIGRTVRELEIVER
jgi:phage tail sheath protein FI